MRQHIVGCHEIGLPAFCCEGGRQPYAEEILHDVDGFLPGLIGREFGGLDTIAGNAQVADILEQVAVVGCNFHHPARGSKSESIRHVADIKPAMIQPAGGIRTQIGIVIGKEMSVVDHIHGLGKPAVAANHHLQGIVSFLSNGSDV